MVNASEGRTQNWEANQFLSTVYLLTHLFPGSPSAERVHCHEINIECKCSP